jgi:AcrR family transcriptional regulator
MNAAGSHTSAAREGAPREGAPRRRGGAPGGRAARSREALLDTAERLFAEHGIVAVSNRQISEAAGQGNTSAVGYHFGSRLDLVRAVAERHFRPVEERRSRMVATIVGSTDVRDWVECMVRPRMEHLEALGQPTWYARFVSQTLTDPALRGVVQEALQADSLRTIVAGLERCLPDMPAVVRAERDDMARQLLVHVVAERERALADGQPTPRATWDDAATGLVDAITGLWLAPWSVDGTDRRG